MTDQHTQDHRADLRRPLLPGRTRMIGATLGGLLSLVIPTAVVAVPGLTADGHTVSPPGTATGADFLQSSEVPSSDPAPTTTPTAVPDPTPGAPTAAGGGIATPPDLPDGPLGIPGNVLDAYQFAQKTLADTQPGCHLSWLLLAGIGRIESDHADGGRLDAYGTTLGPILGPPLDGSPGVATVADTDHGVLDGDTVWDRAVGPMQFLPATWRQWGTDGNGDGVADPNNIYDATVTAGRYLCAAGADLSDPAQLRTAVYRYNQSWAYVDLVLQWAQAYQTGVIPTPAAPGPVPPGTTGNGGRSIVTAPAPPAAAALAPATPPATPLTKPSPPPTAATTTPQMPTTTSPATPTTAPTPTITAPTPDPRPSPSLSPTTTPAAPTTTAPQTMTSIPTLDPRTSETMTVPTPPPSPPSPSPRPAHPAPQE